MAVVASATGAAVFGLSGVAAGLAGGALLGAGAGALYSGITGDGDILNSALTGGLIGGGIGGLGAAFGPGAAAGELAAGGAGLTGGGAFMPAAGSGASFAVPTAASVAAAAPTPALASSILSSSNPAALDALAASQGVFAEGSAALPGAGLNVAPSVIQGAAPVEALNPWQAEVARTQASTLTPANVLSQTKPGMSGMEMLGYGLAGTTALSLLGGMNQKKLTAGQYPGQSPSQIRPYTYSSTQNTSAYPTGPQYGPNGLPILPKSEQSYFTQGYTAGTPYNAAAGGLMAAPPVPGMMQSGPANVSFMGNDMYPTSQQHRSFYATPTQMPTGAQAAMAAYEPKTNPLTGELTANMASGGIADAYNLGSYSDGGRLLKGPGDGVSDDIPAVIGDKQPARLADGEFVIPARIVSELGNGSTDAGAKRLYAMMDKIQAGRAKTIGKDNVAKDTKAKKHLLA